MDMDIGLRRAQEAQLEKLQRQMTNIQQTMNEQTVLRRQLENLMEAEEARYEQTYDKVTSRNMMLKDDIDRRSLRDATRSPGENNNKVLEEVMNLRTKEFQRSQAKKANQMNNLIEERQKILEARSRLQEKRELLRQLPSPVGSDVSEIEIGMTAPRMSTTPSYRSVHSANSQVKRALRALPKTVDRIWSIRERVVLDYDRRLRPYNGELGMGSYQEWQLPDYFMVKRLVEEFVDDFLIKHTPADNQMFERDMRLRMENLSKQETGMTHSVLKERKCVTLLSEEILLEVTSEMTHNVAIETHQVHFLYKNLSRNAFIKEAEIQATGNPMGRDPEDEAYELLTRAFQTLQKDRDVHKKGVWAHSQVMTHPAVLPVKPLKRDAAPTPQDGAKPKPKPVPKPGRKKDPNIPPPDEEPLEADVNLIRHDHLLPENLRLTRPLKNYDKQEKKRKFWREVYKKRELQYWTKLSPYSFKMGLAKRGQGVEVMTPSPDHMMVAVGMKSGDVLVLNTLVEPWSLVKLDIAPPGHGSVVHLAWSLDSSSLMAVRKSGTVTVWNANGIPASAQAISAMGVNTKGRKNLPLALDQVASLESKKGAFTLTTGPLAKQKNVPSKPTPVIANFFPSLTYLCSQSVICAGLESGEIFKFDILGSNSETNQNRNLLLKPNIPVENEEDVNLTKGDWQIELLRQHKYPIITLGCIENIGKLVSVDSKGFINIWTYDTDHFEKENSEIYDDESQHQTQFGWFFPEAKYRLDFNKTMYSQTGNKPKVVFTDRARSKGITRARIAKERRGAQALLDGIQLGHPWHVSIDKPGLETSVYIPPGGSVGSGSVFNIVVRHIKTGQLSTYMTCHYTPLKIGCSKLLCVQLSPSGKQLVFVMLFPGFPPKEPHLMVLVLELLPVRLRKFRYDHPVTDQQFTELMSNKIPFSAKMSQVYGPTGSDYLFISLAGEFWCVSLGTGASVLTIGNPSRPKARYFKGLLVDQKQFELTRTTKVCFVGNMGSLYAVFYDQNATGLKILRLEDGNSHEDARMLWKAFQQWERFQPTPIEIRINPIDWALPDMKHKLAEMRSFLLSLVFGPATPGTEEIAAIKSGNYAGIQDEATTEAMLLDL